MPDQTGPMTPGRQGGTAETAAGVDHEEALAIAKALLLAPGANPPLPTTPAEIILALAYLDMRSLADLPLPNLNRRV